MTKTCSRSPLESHLESLIPIVHPRWKRTVVTVTDSVKGNAKGTTRRARDVDDDVPPITCQICFIVDESYNKKEKECIVANYKCPKCSIPYCSVACYQRHGATCTESFYRARVTQEMDLRQKEDHDADEKSTSSNNQIHRILNRVHKQQQQEQQQLYNEPFQDHDTDDDDNMISTAELERLQDALDRGEGHDIQLSPELQAAFERDIQSGNLNHIVKSWHPWWRPLFHVDVDAAANDNLVDDCDDSDNDDIGIDAMDLDEQILQIPPLSQFIHSPPPDLSFNLVSILYAISQTLILFGGPVPARCVEAAETMIVLSPVLSHDERYHSLPQVLMALQEQSKHDNHHHHSKSCNYTDDIAQLLSNPRHVAHALLDGIHIFRHVTKTNTLTKEERVHFKKIRKKLEFYLSWSRGGGGLDMRDLATEIRTWQQDWALLPHDLDLQTLQLS